MHDIYSQHPHRCKLDWGSVGAVRASQRGDIVVIVDVLSFSTSVIHAVSRGAVILPRGEGEDADKGPVEPGAEVAVGRQDVPEKGRFSLSPLTFDNITEGTKVLLPSLNGGTCIRCAEYASSVIVGAPINASAVARVVSEMMSRTDRNVTVIACGEREKESNDLRPAIEDYLGAGAILSAVLFDKSPEAQVCQSAFEANRAQIGELLWDSVSGRELREIGFGDDVVFASRTDTHEEVPLVKGNILVGYTDRGAD